MIECVDCPPELEEAFLESEKQVKEFFSKQEHDVKTGIRTLGGDRYMLVRAEALGHHIRKTAEKIVGHDTAKMFMYNFGKAIGESEAKAFHKRFNLKTPMDKLSAGPVYFNYSGFAKVIFLPGCNPVPNEDCVFVYEHPNSFEAVMQIKYEGRSKDNVCYMNAGYSAGWTEESFGIPLVSREIICTAKGDEACRFVLAHPSKIDEFIEHFKKEWGL